MRHSWLTKFGVICVNQLVPDTYLVVEYIYLV